MSLCLLINHFFASMSTLFVLILFCNDVLILTISLLLWVSLYITSAKIIFSERALPDATFHYLASLHFHYCRHYRVPLYRLTPFVTDGTGYFIIMRHGNLITATMEISFHHIMMLKFTAAFRRYISLFTR